MLRRRAKKCYECFLNLCCVERISIVDDNEAPNAMILSGYGGTGKFFTIKAAMEQKILKLNNGMCTILIMTPTGEAALNAVTNAIYCNFSINYFSFFEKNLIIVYKNAFLILFYNLITDNP